MNIFELQAQLDENLPGIELSANIPGGYVEAKRFAQRHRFPCDLSDGIPDTIAGDIIAYYGG